MHDYVMGTLGKYVKEAYCCPEKFTKQDLCELKEWGKTMEALLKADTQYNIVKQMEEGENENIEMTVDEMTARFTKMYNEASPSDKAMIKSSVNRIMA